MCYYGNKNRKMAVFGQQKRTQKNLVSLHKLIERRRLVKDLYKSNNWRLGTKIPRGCVASGILKSARMKKTPPLH